MAANRIEFHGDPKAIERYPAPYPASAAIPQWLKDMPADTPDGGAATLKRCAPFLEAMTGGYIIPFPADIRISTTAPQPGQIQVHVEVAGIDAMLVEAHPKLQFPGAPFATMPVLKFVNPWLIKTSPGYSVLFLQPINRFADPIVPLSGVVETDTYYHEVNFPSVCLLAAGKSHLCRRGTPMVQVIPFKREDWTGRVVQVDSDARTRSEGEWVENPHVYKDKHWARRSFEMPRE